LMRGRGGPGTDVRGEKDVEAMIRRTVDEFGRVAIVVINAAGSWWWERVIETPPKTLRPDVAGEKVRAEYLAAIRACTPLIASSGPPDDQQPAIRPSVARMAALHETKMA